MASELLNYEAMVEAALRGVVREALAQAAAHGLPGGHHFYVTFRTAAPGVELPEYLRARYPDEMTIILEHQFWDLAVGDQAFSVTLSFRNRPERLVIPLAALTAFADPSVKWGLQFRAPAPPQGAAEAGGAAASPVAAEPTGAAAAAKPPGEVVALDAFRKK